MKIIRENKTDKVKYAFNDDERIIVNEDTIVIPNFPPPKKIGTTTYTGGTTICDMGSKNAEIIEDVILPADFEGDGFTYDKEKEEFTKISIT